MLQVTQVNVHAATEAQRLLDPHQVAHLIVLLSAFGRRKSTVPLRVVPVSKLRPFETLLLEVRQERGVAEREQATFLDLLAARKILEEERAHLSSLN